MSSTNRRAFVLLPLILVTAAIVPAAHAIPIP